MSSLMNAPWLLAQAAGQAATLDEGMSMPIKIGVAFGILIGSFVVGIMLANALRMADYGVKFGIVIFSVVASVVVCILGWPPKLGIDLSGGVVLVYEVDAEQLQTTNLSDVIGRLNRELNAGQSVKITARTNAQNEIEVPIPKSLDEAEVAKRVEKSAPIDFKLTNLGQRKVGEQSVLVYKLDGGRKSVDMGELVAAVSRRVNPDGVKEVTVRQYGLNQIEVIIPEVEDREIEQIKKIISTSGMLEFRILADETRDAHQVRLARDTVGKDVYDGAKLVARWVKPGPENYLLTGGAVTRQIEQDGEPVTELLVLIDPYNVKGGDLTRAGQSYDQQAKPCVHFSFTSRGAHLFGALTSENVMPEESGFKRRLGIVLDSVVLSAPNIVSRIDHDGQITGNFTEEEIQRLVQILNAGSLPAALRPQPISQQRISAQLGADTIHSGTRAMIISTLAILIFMAFYYGFAGFVADFSVLVNTVVTVALMIMIKAAFTLPGLAGMVLTVGMAVDANVLIYERMREELAKGASVRMAIRNGFARAMSTIIDSNLTTLITAIVLYIIGTDQVKGFAVTLIIGLLVSMYTAIFVSRVIFDVADKQRWIRQLKMRQFFGHTNFDFIKWRGPALAGSAAVILIGMLAVFARGKDLFDIDFTGGSAVTVLFDKEESIANVRNKLNDVLPDVAVSSVGDNNQAFLINTSNGNLADVETKLQKTFGDALKTYSFKVEKTIQIAEADIPLPPGAKPAATDKPATETKPAEPELKPAANAPPAEPEKKPEPTSEPAKTEPPKTDAPKSEPPAKTEEPAKADEPAKTEAPKTETPAKTEPEAKPEPAKTEPAKTEPEGKPEADKKPASTDGAAGVPSADKLLASATTDPRLIALLVNQTEPAKDAKPAEPAADDKKPADEAKPADAPAKPAEPAAEDKKPADETKPAAAAKPAEETPPATESPAAAESTTPGGAAAASTTTGAIPVSTLDKGFVGGTRAVLRFGEPIKRDTFDAIVREEATKLGLPLFRFHLEGGQKDKTGALPQTDWTLSTTLPDADSQKLLSSIDARLKNAPVFPSSSEIGSKVADDAKTLAIMAMLASWVAIVIYVWFRFQNLVFGLASVLALVHDVMVTVGFLALSAYLAPYLGFLQVDPFKISLAVVAALLTIIGFSINDTIVIFDRIREIRGKSPEVTAPMVNQAINETLSRTFITSGTVFIASVILYFLGGQGIHAFAFAMVMGVIAGTYSTVYIAAPIVLWMRKPAPERETVGAGR